MGTWDRQREWIDNDKEINNNSKKIKYQPEKGNPDGIVIDSLKNLKAAPLEKYPTKNNEIIKITKPNKPIGQIDSLRNHACIKDTKNENFGIYPRKTIFEIIKIHIENLMQKIGI